MQNITPEEREYWDKKMADHAKRQKPPIAAILLLICSVIIVALIRIVFTISHEPTPPPRTPEVILNDTFQMKAGDISRDTTLDAMKRTDVGREYDSLVRARNDTATYRPYPGTIIFHLGLSYENPTFILMDGFFGDHYVEYMGSIIAQRKKDSAWEILDYRGVEKVKELIIKQQEDSL